MCSSDLPHAHNAFKNRYAQLGFRWDLDVSMRYFHRHLDRLKPLLTRKLGYHVTYHDSCSGLRELGVKRQPRTLLDSVQGLTLRELPGAETCCGFGGTFCVKYPEISDKMVASKAEDILATGADTLLAGDMGCLMNMAGKLKRLRTEAGARPTKVRHVAEVLAGLTDEPPIGEAGK